MPIGDGATWDESNPTDATLANQIDDYQRDLRKGTRARLAIEHVWPLSQTGTSEAGYHTYITFQNQTGIPTMPVVASSTQSGMLFMSAGNLFFQNSAAGVATLIASGAGLNVANALYSTTGTLGDLLIGTSGGTLHALAIGSSGQILTASTGGTGVVWASNSALLTVTANGSTVVPSALKIYMGTSAMAGGTASVTVAFSDGNYIVHANRLGTYHTEAVCIIGKSAGGFTLRDDNIGSNTIMWIAMGT